VMNLKDHLNDAQYQAVTTLEGPLLVIAGAGSGKTRVIEYRALHLVKSGVNPSSILLLTFTRRAASEMISRASRHDPRCRDIDGGTFHSFAYKVIKRYAKAVGFEQDLLVLDESDAQDALHRCATVLSLYERDKRFPKKDTLKTIISMSINKASPISEIVKREYPHFVEYIEDIKRLAMAYAEYKIKRGYLDYDDMLIYLKAMLENKEIHKILSDRYRYIMVDEYQDTNLLQAEIASLIASPLNNIMIVGDDAQSIYGFRGANHKNIMNFPERFPDCKIIKLEVNYRSTQSVLNCANAVLETMDLKYNKALRSANNYEGIKPYLIFFKNAYEEAEGVADTIVRFINEGVGPSQIAVLCRSMYLTIPLQAELAKRNIPYDTYGGIKFYEMAHVKDLLCHLKVMVNPRDELSWHRALMLLDGVGAKTSERLTSSIMGLSSLNEALRFLSDNATSLKRPESLRGLVKALSAATQVSKREVGAVFDIIFDYYKPIMRHKFDDWHLRVNDLETLRQVASRYGSLDDMLNDLAIEPPERAVLSIEPETRDEDRPLCVSTIHSAKGLEWDVVFIMGLIDGVLPISFALDNEEDLEEEKRLLYVAITRAKRRLFLTMHHQGRRNGITQFNRPSRFLRHQRVIDSLDLIGESIHHDVGYRCETMPLTKGRDWLLRRVLEHYKGEGQ
jgi:DNA helicase-2/ATP-dependent DNA helicase PcrA